MQHVAVRAMVNQEERVIDISLQIQVSSKSVMLKYVANNFGKKYYFKYLIE